MKIGSNHIKHPKTLKNGHKALFLWLIILQEIAMSIHWKTHVLKICQFGLILVLICLNASFVFSQTAITSFNTSTAAAPNETTLVTAPSDATNSVVANKQYNVNYGEGDDVFLVDYTIGATLYENFLFPDTLVIRRTDGSRFINIWYSLNATINNVPTIGEIDLVPTKVDDADAIYQERFLNGGYDNILVNVDDLAGATIQAQVERIDLIWYSGILTSSPTTAVYPIMERGGNDNIKVAGITSLDGNGDPSGYTSLVTLNSTDWTGGTFSIGTQMILRRQTVGDDPIPILNSASQSVEGIAVSFSDLGIAANEISYGFSIFASDVILEDLVDFATFPNTSLSSVSGLDLVASLAAAVASDDELIPHTGPGGYKAALSTWLKANEGVTTATEGSGVTLWEDQALGNNDFTNLGTAPTYRITTSDINFNPTVDFISGSETGMQTPDNPDFNVISGNPGYTNKGINIAFRTSSTDIASKQQLFEQGGGTNGLGLYISGGDIHMSVWNRGGNPQGDWNDNASGVETVSASVALNTEYIVTLEFAGDPASAGGGSITGYLNGQSIGSLTTPHGQNIGLLYNHGDDIGLGDNDNASAFHDGFVEGDSFYGEISEFIYCNEPSGFALAVRQRIESYLALKYGITLDQSSPYNYVNSSSLIIFNTTNAAAIGGYLEYNNDIAGIGRDDNSEFEQPQSRSENMGSIVTIDKGASIGVDNTWLIWGNDAASTAETALLTMPSAIEMRIGRVWRVAEEKEMGEVSVSFDLAELGLPTGDAGVYSILIAGNSSSADFSSATILTGGVIVGSTITFSGVSLEDGEYFTLGTQNFVCAPGGVLGGLSLWLRADMETYNVAATTLATDGQTVEQWGDQSTNDFDANEDINRNPTWGESVINFNPALNWDAGTNTIGFNLGSNYIFADEANGGLHIFSAVDPVDVGTNNSTRQNKFIYDFGNRFANSVGLGASTLRGSYTNPGNQNNTGISTLDVAVIMEADFDISIASPDAKYLIMNAELERDDFFDFQLDAAAITENSTHASNQGPVSIGRMSETNGLNNQNGRRFFGDMAEVIVFNEELTAVEEQQVRSYLALKYGVTLSDDNDSDNTEGELLGGTVTEGDYVASDGTTIFWNYGDHEPTYVNDVAGIGRDDASCFEQKQSSSVNADGIVTMGLGEISANNAANPNNIDTDLEFLLWANDNDFTDQANANTADLPTGVTERMERIWKVQETGTVAATTISFDLNGLGYSSTATDFQLIVSGTATMAGGTLFPAASLVGGILTFNNIDLTDGQFFTIGTGRDVCAPGGVSAGLILALRGEAGITGTTVVTAWEDQSIAGNNVTATTGPELITNGINYNPSLQFNGTNETMAVVNGILGTSTQNDLVVFAVTEVSTVQNSQLFYEDLASSEVFSGQIPWGDANAQYDYPDATGGVGRVSGAWGGTTGSANIWTMFSSTSSFSTASGNINKGIFRDGILIASNTSSQTGTGNNSDFNIGSNGASNFYDADIAEILIYSTAPTTQQLEQIQTYLAIKYGIFKDSPDNGSTGGVDERDYFRADATVIWDYSINTAYHEDVAGIGRDDDACLNQKQSSSEGTDDILAIGLGTIAADNASNVNSFASNGDFMVWGNDNGSTAQANVNTADVPGIVEERMERVWRVDETGTVGDTEVSFDLTGLGYTSDPNDFQLIISSTSTMASGVTFGGGTIIGNILTFTGVDFADGDYFTIGTSLLVCGPGGVFTNLELWLRADIGTSTTVDNGDLTGASAWLDQSVNANNGAEANLGGGTPVEPTYQANEINFNPVVSFIDPGSTNSSYINTTSNTVSGDMTLISLFRTGQDQGVLDDFINTPAIIGANAPGTADYGLGMYQGQLVVNANTSTVFDATTTASYNVINPHFVLATRDQSSGAIEIFVEGLTAATGTGSTAALTDPTSFGVGNHSDPDVQAQFNGDIAEAIVFSSILTGEQQSRVETYLAIKYGLTISNNRNGNGTANEVISGIIREGDYVAGDGNIVWDYLNQGALYYNDIFGIGRDDVSCFDQPQSKSENADAMVTFNYASGFDTNDSWLISGNDNAPIEATDNPERPLTINSRLNREWRVQETGTVGSIELTYDLSSVTGTPLGNNNLNLVRLMVDDDGDFSNGGTTLIAPSSIDGGAQTVTFNVDFTDGQYYTLGSTEVDALPITLISFEARTTTDNLVEVAWTTAQEVNNSFYTIERSNDGINFEVLGYKDGAGNSATIIDYSFIDQKPYDGVSYYRLKQTDFNGEFEYSQLSRVYVDINKNVKYRVVPNPVNRGESFKVNYPVTSVQQVNILIVNTKGGYNLNTTISVSPQDGSIEISTADLAKGLYFIRIVDKQLKQVTLKFIVR